MKHFIFGYGSLICPQSRSVTAPTLTSVAEPVIIDGIERTWSARVSKEPSNSNGCGRAHIEGWTPMGVRVRKGAKCNGVLIYVDENELRRFDIRESGYTRREIDVGSIMPHIESDTLIERQMPLWPGNDNSYDSEDLRDLALQNVQCEECRVVFEEGFTKRITTNPNDKHGDSDIAVWVYIQSEDLPANSRYPITQSYLDIIMRGCLAISHDFARRFLETTDGWWHDGKASQQSSDNRTKDTIDHHIWVNDRNDPMYVRADSDYSMEHGEVIDKLIEQHHPEALKRRVM